MCVIAICKSRKLTETEIKNMWGQNSDGSGIAYRKGGKMYFKKGIMDKEKLIETIKMSNLPQVVHFRLASSGPTVPELTHPFCCDDKPITLEGPADKVLFHNGHWQDAEKIMLNLCIFKGTKIQHLDGRWNDSRIIAFLVGHAGDGILNFIPGKFVIVTNNQVVIKMVGEFTEKNGIFVSNTLYENFWRTNEYYKKLLGSRNKNDIVSVYEKKL